MLHHSPIVITVYGKVLSDFYFSPTHKALCTNNNVVRSKYTRHLFDFSTNELRLRVRILSNTI